MNAGKESNEAIISRCVRNEKDIKRFRIPDVFIQSPLAYIGQLLPPFEQHKGLEIHPVNITLHMFVEYNSFKIVVASFSLSGMTATTRRDAYK